MQDTDPRLLLLSPDDNVFVLRAAIEAGETLTISGKVATIRNRIGMGHKLARGAITAGDKVLKYGAPIGSATQDIALGDHVHVHNVKSDYTATYSLESEKARFGGEA
jgi:hypothetical protein